MARAASVGNRAPAHGGEASRGVLSSASDDGGGLTARCACSTQKRAASVGNRAPAHGGEASRGVLSSASDDGGGLTARCACSTQKRAASVGNRAPAHGGEASRGVLSSASDDGGGLTARCASSTQKKGDSGDMDDRTGVAVVGSINADLAAFGSPLPRPGETVIGTDFSLVLGGKGANQATA